MTITVDKTYGTLKNSIEEPQFLGNLKALQTKMDNLTTVKNKSKEEIMGYLNYAVNLWQGEWYLSQ